MFQDEIMQAFILYKLISLIDLRQLGIGKAVTEKVHNLSTIGN